MRLGVYLEHDFWKISNHWEYVQQNTPFLID